MALIERSAAIDAAIEAADEWDGGSNPAREARIRAWVDGVPAVDAVPVRHGRWVYDKNGMDWDLPAWICSECHDRNDMIPTHVRGIDGMIQVKNPLIWSGSSYCPNCGAKMDGKDGNE